MVFLLIEPIFLPRVADANAAVTIGSPLTVADAYSGVLLSYAARLSTTPVETRPIFARLFHGYGLPEALRTDHGAPRATPV
jgi:hypothetical protein